MKLLPVALQVEGTRCLVVGGGAVGQRKVESLLDAGAAVTVIAPVLNPGLRAIAGNMEHRSRVFQQGDCAGFHLVFACTDRPDVNAAVAQEARLGGIWCNIADDPAGSDFHSAARVQRGEIGIGITTTGGSPALARHLRKRIEACIGPEYEQLLEIMRARRAEVKAGSVPQQDRAALWQAILASEVLPLLREGRRADAETLVDGMIDSLPHD